MKRLRSGFTLAEVLITLAIIGVVAAIVMPSVMSNYQYKSVGVKVAKFMSTVEAASRPFVVNDGNFSITSAKNAAADGNQANDNQSVSNVTDFVNEAFLFKGFDQGSGLDNTISEYPNVNKKTLPANYEAIKAKKNAPLAYLKDGTAIQVYLDNTSYDTDHLNIVPVEKYGSPVFRIAFDPRVQGLPASAHKNFNFTVTELGYIFPHNNDDCLWLIYNNDFATTSKMFASGADCHVGSGTPATP